MIYIYKRSAISNYREADAVSHRTSASAMSGTAAMGLRLAAKMEELALSVDSLKSGVFSDIKKDIQALLGQINTPTLEKKQLMTTVDSLVMNMEVLATEVSEIAGSVDDLDAYNKSLVTKCTSLEEGLLTSLVSLTRVSRLLCDGLSKEDADSAADDLERDIIETGGEGTEYTDRILSEAEAVNQKLTGFFASQNTFDFDFEAPVAAASGGLLSVAALEKHTRQYEGSGGRYRDAFNTRRRDAHVKISQYVVKAWGAVDNGLSTETASPLVLEGRSIFSEQQESWSRFREELKGDLSSTEGDKREALMFVSQDVDVEITRFEEALRCLSGKPATSALQQVVKHVSVFVSCESDNGVLETVRKMLHKATQFMALRYGTGVGDTSVLKDSLRNHLLWDDHILSAPGASSLHCVSRTKASALVSFLSALEKEVGSHAEEEESKIKHYCVIERIRSFFENDMTFRVKGAAASGTSTPGKQASFNQASSKKES